MRCITSRKQATNRNNWAQWPAVSFASLLKQAPTKCLKCAAADLITSPEGYWNDNSWHHATKKITPMPRARFESVFIVTETPTCASLRRRQTLSSTPKTSFWTFWLGLCCWSSRTIPPFFLTIPDCTVQPCNVHLSITWSPTYKQKKNNEVLIQASPHRACTHTHRGIKNCSIISQTSHALLGLRAGLITFERLRSNPNVHQNS